MYLCQFGENMAIGSEYSIQERFFHGCNKNKMTIEMTLVSGDLKTTVKNTLTEISAPAND